MELEIIRKLENETKSYFKYEFVNNNKVIAIPYLTFTLVFSLSGTIGNILVLGTLFQIKVSFYTYIS